MHLIGFTTVLPSSSYSFRRRLARFLRMILPATSSPLSRSRVGVATARADATGRFLYLSGLDDDRARSAEDCDDSR
jgi:hypothetical protein